MEAIRQMSAFEVYKKKQKNVNSSQFPKSKHKSKIVKNGKIEKKTKLVKKDKLKVKPVKPTLVEILKKNNVNKLPDQKFTSHKVKNNKQCQANNKNTKITKALENNDQVAEVIANSKEMKFDKLCAEILNTDNNPVMEAEKLFEWLIYPLKKDEFFGKNWEKTPLNIKRNKPKYYKSLMSTPLLDHILRNNYILFTKNLDITSFTNDVRETHNPTGRALPSVVWDYFANGCSVRMLNPQTYISKLNTLNATLQEFFGCFVGANSYLTPPNSQGFAPHYDDIEAFILQIEGKKRWRLYKPKSENEYLARYSSPNYSQKEIGTPILDTVVNAGDLLYFPRGTIHQGDTIGFSEHSLHLTISVYQKNSWSDFFEKLLPIAIKDASENDVRFRKGLPLHYLKHIGSVFNNNDTDTIRKEFLNQTKSLLSTLFTKYINIDAAADEMAKSHIHDFLPPVLDENESLCSIYEGGERMVKDGVIINRVEIEPDTFIRLCRAHCARLVEENSSYRLYYSCDNSKEYHEYEPQFLEVDLEFVPAIQEIITKFPEYVRVEDLPINDLDKKIQIVRDLWEKGIVLSENPLPIIED